MQELIQAVDTNIGTKKLLSTLCISIISYTKVEKTFASISGEKVVGTGAWNFYKSSSNYVVYTSILEIL